MDKWIMGFRALSDRIESAVVDISLFGPIVTISLCNLLLVSFIYFMRKGGEDMKQWIRVFSLALFMLAFIAAGSNNAQASWSDKGPDSAVHHRGGLSASLGLTTDQTTQVKAILQKYRTALQPVLQQLKTQRQQLSKLVETQPIDEAAIRAQVSQLSSAEADLAVQRAHLIQEIQAVLTPDQIQTITAADGNPAAKIDRFIARMIMRGARKGASQQ